MKFRNHKALAIFFCISMAGLIASCHANKTDEKPSDNVDLLDKWEESDCFKFTYKQHDKNTMPIGGWCAPIARSGCNTNEAYRTIKESGINAIYGLYERVSMEDEDIEKALEYADNNDVVYLVRDTSVGALSEDINSLKSHVDNYTKHKSYGGILACDEPGYSQIDSGLINGRNAFRTYYSDLLYYVNLFPNYAAESQLLGPNSSLTNITYEEYLEAYCSKVRPQMLSVDNYPTNVKFPNMADYYFDQLELNSKVASKYKIPWWTFVLTTEHYSYRQVSEVDVDWQVNTALAYGSKGIQYFCYQEPYEFTTGNIAKGGSLIDSNGNKTEVYDYCQRINGQVSRMDHVLMNSTCIARMAFNNSPSKIDKTNFVDSFREIKSITTGDDLLVGCFDYNGKSVFYFVNNNLSNNLTATVNFTSKIEANTYSKTENSTFKGEQATITLEPAQGILFELTNYK